MSESYEKFEGLIPGDGHPRWGQSYYYNAYDPVRCLGVFIRLGFLENQGEANSWVIVFRNGSPLFTRTNLNLPHTLARPADGVEIAGMRIHAEVPLKRTRITFSSPDCSFDLVWSELHPLADCIAMTQDKDGAFAREVAHIHLEGTSTVTGSITHRGEMAALDGKGFRDIAAGPRNWDALLHYRLAWPVFDNGMAFCGIRGISTAGGSAYMRMMHDGEAWRRVTAIEDRLTFSPDGLAVEHAHWVFTDELGRRHEMTARPLFGWLFPFDTFVLREHMMEYRLADGTIGYGLHETGYRLPWQGMAD
ncbi:DUF7064 domain-containing protein [Zavarzinia aquatilis]|uniref:AttH domain-containing protein n=1 Tax=Zavarzinia aquatilis TaxID=2211142 RepID=A0A317EG78_9PROT|nr:hypothetical protein [Zavarzinia aquatilis]PWR25296.1 hypothetical protein DKG74_05915 [Zavarzinia aquatilis]